MQFVHTYDIGIVADGNIATMGLSTCMCLCIITKRGVILWHYGATNIRGVNMNRITALLNTIKTEDIIRVYLVPGVDRNKDLSLKTDCRTMQYRPNTNPYESRDWLFSFLQKYTWNKKLEVINHVKHFKEIVVFNKEGVKYGRDDTFFDRMCVCNAEKMI